MLENVQPEINIGWYLAKFNFKLRFSVNHETAYCLSLSLAHYLSSFFKPDVV